MSTQENKKIIAEFMNHSHPILPSKSTINYLAEDLDYDNDWNWLMPVIQKCLIGEAEHSEDVSNLAIKNIYEGICNQDIYLAYESVVEFINQYNKNK